MQKIIYEHNKNTTKAFRNERKLPVNWKFQEGIKEILLLVIQTRAALILSNLLTKTLIIKSKSQYDVYHDSFINSVSVLMKTLTKVMIMDILQYLYLYGYI